MHYLDDDPDDLDYFKDAVDLTNKKIVLHTYTDADELMESLFKANRNEIVLLDLNMPRKNGFEVLKEIREKEKLRGIPVVIYSTSSNETAINITRDLGASLYVVKPNSFQALKQIIEKIITINWKENDPQPAGFLFKS